MYHLLLAIIVSASIDSTTLMLGDQTDMHLQATIDAQEQLSFPTFDHLLQDEIEIIDRTIVDTITLDDGRKQLHQYLTITSFTDSLYTIHPIPFVSGNDTFWSESLALNVIQPFEVDSSLAITDIKDIEKAPIWWWGIFRWVVLAIVLIGAGIGVYYLVRWLKSKEQEKEVINPELLRPADEVALEKLDIIKEQKIWKEGKHKEYHTQLTDVIREYVSRRYEINSTEKTSDETLRALKPMLRDQRELFHRLEKMLQVADLVKFAKWQPLPDECERSFHQVTQFVDQTKEIEIENKDKE
mgnify:CR=1 FL=1